MLIATLRCVGMRLPRLCAWRELLHASRIRTFLSQMAPRTLSVGLEQVALQSVGALAGRLGPVPTATHNAMLLVFFWLTSFVE